MGTLANSIHLHPDKSALFAKIKPGAFRNYNLFDMCLEARKPVFGGLGTTQVQTSLRIRVV